MNNFNLLQINKEQDLLVKLGQAFMDATADFHNKECDEILKQYPGLSQGGAMDVSYLRTRSRHSPELEKRLVKEHMEGKTIMIYDWPDHSDKNYDPFTGKPL